MGGSNAGRSAPRKRVTLDDPKYYIATRDQLSEIGNMHGSTREDLEELLASWGSHYHEDEYVVILGHEVALKVVVE